MKTSLSRNQAEGKIKAFFEKSSFTPSELKKIKHLAMKFKIKLRDYRKKFCKRCLSPLKGRIRITKTHKTIYCGNCGCRNRFKLR